MKAAILIFSLILSITVKVNGLQCYVCYDCAKPTADSLLNCEDYASNSTTTTSSTTESATNSSSTTTSTTTPSTTTLNSTSSSITPTDTTSSTDSTTTPTTTTPTTTISTTAPDANATDTNATYVRYGSVERADSFECFSGTINVSNTIVTVRGCAINPANNSCVASGLSDCNFCNTDKCNGASAVHSSAALLCILFLGLLYKE